METTTTYNKRKEFKKRNNQIIISPPIIDKLKVRKKFHYARIFDMAVKALKAENPNNKLYKEVKDSFKHNRTSIVFHLPSNDIKKPYTTLWFNVNPDESVIELEYNPSKVAEPAYGLFREEVLNDTPWTSLFDFIADAEVTKLHVCRNLFNFNMDDYIFRGSWFQNYGCFKNSKNKIETIYFGRERSSRVVIYNKKKQDKENYRDYDHVARLERQLGKINLTVRELPDFQAPFDRIEIYMADLSRLDFVPPQFRFAVMDSIQARGLNNVLGLLCPSPADKEKALRQVKQEAWQPWVDSLGNWKAEWLEALKTYHLHEDEEKFEANDIQTLVAAGKKGDEQVLATSPMPATDTLI